MSDRENRIEEQSKRLLSVFTGETLRQNYTDIPWSYRKAVAILFLILQLYAGLFVSDFSSDLSAFVFSLPPNMVAFLAVAFLMLLFAVLGPFVGALFNPLMGKGINAETNEAIGGHTDSATDRGMISLSEAEAIADFVELRLGYQGGPQAPDADEKFEGLEHRVDALERSQSSLAADIGNEIHRIQRQYVGRSELRGATDSLQAQIDNNSRYVAGIHAKLKEDVVGYEVDEFDTDDTGGTEANTKNQTGVGEGDAEQDKEVDLE